MVSYSVGRHINDRVRTWTSKSPKRNVALAHTNLEGSESSYSTDLERFSTWASHTINSTDLDASEYLGWDKMQDM